MQSISWFVLIGLVAFLNIFLFRSIGSFGVQLFLIGIWSFFAILGALRKQFHSKPYLFIGTSLALMILTFLTLLKTNPTILLLLHLSSFSVVLLTIYSVISSHPHFIALMEVLSIPFTLVGAYFESLQKVATGKTDEPAAQMPFTSKMHSYFTWQKMRPLIGGLILSIPVLFILVTLFAQADPVFEKFVNDFFKQSFFEHMIWRVVFSFVCFLIGVPMLFMRQKHEFKNPLNAFAKWHMLTEFSVVMSMVALVMGMFLTIQWKYVFVPAVEGVNLSQFGVQTYSEYVNRGFSELLTASLFIFGLIWAGLILMRTKSAQEIKFLKTAQIVVLAEFFVLLFSNLRRIWLYQHFHGMSLVRFYGGYFLIFLVLLTVTLTLRHFMKFRFVIIEILFTILSIVGLSLFNVEEYIALKHPPTVNGRVDYVYLSRMSPDGFEGWKKSYGWVKEVFGQQFDEQKKVDAEQRRELAYAAISLEQLMSRYDEMIFETGTEAEQKEYVQSMIDDQKKTIDFIENRLNDNFNSVPKSNPMSAEEMYKDERKDLEALKTDFQARSSLRLSSEPGNTAVLHPIITSPVQFGKYRGTTKIQWSDFQCRYWGRCNGNLSYLPTYPYTFYTFQSLYIKGTKSTQLDQLLTWDPGKQAVLARMKSEIPLSDLLTLQRRYFEILRLTLTNSDTDFDYDADLSFDTPFLKPFHNDYFMFND